MRDPTKWLHPLNLADFTGGLNLRADAFELKDNESPEMLNVDVDPRGGVRSRRGWVRYNGTAITGTGNSNKCKGWKTGGTDLCSGHRLSQAKAEALTGTT